MTDEEFTQMYTDFAPMVERRCRHLLRSADAARDATHDVFVKALKLSRERRIEHPSSLLWRIATNHCLNQIAKKSWSEARRRTRTHRRSGSSRCSMGPVTSRLARRW